MTDTIYLEKLTRILEESFQVTRSIDMEHTVKCDLCGRDVHNSLRVSGRTIGLDCDCPETIFLLLISFDQERVMRVASELGIELEVKNVTIKEINLSVKA